MRILLFLEREGDGLPFKGECDWCGSLMQEESTFATHNKDDRSVFCSEACAAQHYMYAGDAAEDGWRAGE